MRKRFVFCCERNIIPNSLFYLLLPTTTHINMIIIVIIPIFVYVFVYLFIHTI